MAHGKPRLEGPGRIVVREDCWLDVDVDIDVRSPTATVELGEGCLLSGVTIRADADVTFGEQVEVKGPLTIEAGGPVWIGKGCLFDRASGFNAITTVGPRGAVRVGAECYVNGLDVVATEAVTLGDRCIVGTCWLVTTDFHSTGADRWSPDAPVKSGPIVIGDNVWLAARTVVTKGVTIGDDSVVSIGTIVREDVPAGVIVSSHEQRTVKRLDPRSAPPDTWPPPWRRGLD